ncbi:DUF742 domain-containing protein [Saccharomonospora saliphila]|uniref:DUF742 domain-containing protein n=1 Tax=Saccharomonospora saliphila TaxID=369829 RepID=UPI00037777CB|nr:DUF742 domain-containing protein [Saccharomonospora saliphila]
MNSGHARGDRRLDQGRAAGRRSGGADGEPYDRADRGWRGGWADARPSELDTGEWLRSGGLDSPGPSDSDLGDHGQTLFSGPGAELYGMGGGGVRRPGEQLEGYPASGRGRFDGGPSSHDYGPPSRDYGPPSWDYGPPSRDYGPPSREYGPPSRDYGPPSGDLGPPSWDHGSPSRDYGPPSGEFAPAAAPGRPGDDEPVEDEGSGLVRPYFRTRGRTKPDYDLAIEALISTSERGRRLERVRVPEHRSICGLCLDTRSVAEVAALLGMPLGVVRVLVGDVAGLGLVLVHSASSMVGDRPSIEFMERVLSGLRRI